jgi:hypothetical protein
MNVRTIKRFRWLNLLLVALLLFTATPGWAEETPNPNTDADAAKQTIDTMINYDSKMRVGRMVLESVKESTEKGKNFDFGKLKDKIVNKPILTHFGIEQGLGVVGFGIQYVMMGAMPPFGTAIGALANSILNATGGAVGYEASVNLESGKEMSKRQLVGESVKKIDAPSFVARTTGSVVGALIGQAICPIPFLGVMVGGMVGGFLGGMVTAKLRKVMVLDKGAVKLQEAWGKMADKISGTTASTQLAPSKVQTVVMARDTDPGIRERIRVLHKQMMEILNKEGINSDAAKRTMEELRSLQLKVMPAK